ncbi:hypothetical protein [Kocuria arenosa]|uniref:hypothetical protein n=1 Tax=Kocuria arenosa TaxID=3071446 RepID=UPI0034D77342
MSVTMPIGKTDLLVNASAIDHALTHGVRCPLARLTDGPKEGKKGERCNLRDAVINVEAACFFPTRYLEFHLRRIAAMLWEKGFAGRFAAI